MRTRQVASENASRAASQLGQVIGFVFLCVSLSGCHGSMQVADTTDVTDELTIRRDGDQRITMLLVHAGSATTPEPAEPAARDADSLAEVFINFMNSHAEIYGIVEQSDLPVFELRKGLGPTGTKSVPDLEPQPDDAGPDEAELLGDLPAVALSILDFSQEYRGVRLLNGNLRVSFINGKLFSIKGTAVPLGEWAGHVDQLVSTSTIPFDEIMRSQCSEYDEDLQTSKLSKSPYFSPSWKRTVYLVLCDHELMVVDSVTGESISSSTPPLLEPWSKANVSMLGTIDGSVLSTPRPWVPAAVDGDSPDDDTRLHLGVRVDRTASITPGKCDWQTSYGIESGGEHPYPKAKLRGDDWIERGYSCDDRTPHPFRYITPNHLWAQGAYELMQRAAWHAKTSAMMRQLTWVSTINAPVHNDHAPTAKIYRVNGDEGECGPAPGTGAVGSYAWFDDRICVNPSRSANVYRTPLHEYGHYMNDVLGWNHGAPDNILDGWECGALAAHEGSADAHVINYLHRRFLNNIPGQALSDADLSNLFMNGPGPGMRRRNGEGPLFRMMVDLGVERENVRVSTQSEDDVLSAANVCSGDNWPGKWWHYRDGMAISQVLWKFLNNKVCNFDSTGMCVPEKMKQGIALSGQNSNWEMKAVGREAFTYAITQGGHDSPWDFLQDMAAWICATRPVHLPDPDDFDRASRAFAQNGAPMYCWY